MFRTIVTVLVMGMVMLFTACSPEGFEIGDGNDFTDPNPSDNPMTIDNIVTDASFPLLAPVSEASIFPMHLLTAATTEFYHGRFFLNNGGSIESGYCSFKMVKNTTDNAFFADWKIHRMVEIVDPENVNVLFATDFDMEVDANYHSTDNFIRISDNSRRHIAFGVQFGQTTEGIANITNGSALFTNDYSTVIGGDNRFCFIATRGSSVPTVVTENDLSNTFNATNFTISGTSLTENSVVVDTISNVGDIGDLVISAMNGNDVSFLGGLAELKDEETAAYIYNESGAFSGLTSIDGIIVVAPNKNYSLRFDFNTDNDYFAGTKQ